MKKGTRSLAQVKLIYVVTTAFLVILSLYTFLQIKDLIDSSNWVNHTILVTQSLHKISSDVFDAETNKRGYLLTGDSFMLHKKETALTHLSLEQQILEGLIKDDKTQVNNYTLLNSDIKKKIRFLNNNSTPVNNIQINASLKDITSKSTLARDTVMEQLEKMYRVETGLLQQREERFAHLSYITPIFIMVLFIGSFIILWASYQKINTALLHSQYLRNELTIQDKEKEQKAATLIVANIELAYQNKEKEQKSAELIIANKELAFQNREKERKAKDLVIANKELEFQNKEKEQRAAELVIANKELEYQNLEKEQRAAELDIANKELAYQNREKERKAKELVIANKELVDENELKEQRAIELTKLNEELKLFTQIASHDLQEPLRKIQTFASRIMDNEQENLSEKGKEHFEIIDDAATRMRTLIEDLIAYSHTTSTERTFALTDLNVIIEEIKIDLEDTIIQKHATIESRNLCHAKIIPFQFRQMMSNLLYNALKFSNPDIPPHIIIDTENKKGKELDNKALLPDKEYCHISISDNGIGFDAAYNEKIFEVFQRLHGKDIYKGTGIGLAIVKKIVENHNGIIKATGKLGVGARFDIYLPS